jgi:hypothetical protein
VALCRKMSEPNIAHITSDQDINEDVQVKAEILETSSNPMKLDQDGNDDVGTAISYTPAEAHLLAVLRREQEPNTVDAVMKVKPDPVNDSTPPTPQDTGEPHDTPMECSPELATEGGNEAQEQIVSGRLSVLWYLSSHETIV